ncbi:unnamed protein product [Pieris brassicae]|uniref:Uncharacterized protein n=1 Tax=Pieris brassicae TaxID=7116 RepID=A0A9P0TUS5_PIEBR|nr:unnamed protein product [Pieris brassicae]
MSLADYDSLAETKSNWLCVLCHSKDRRMQEGLKLSLGQPYSGHHTRGVVDHPNSTVHPPATRSPQCSDVSRIIDDFNVASEKIKSDCASQAEMLQEFRRDNESLRADNKTLSAKIAGIGPTPPRSKYRNSMRLRTQK